VGLRPHRSVKAFPGSSIPQAYARRSIAAWSVER
jgi:hypothetical protein